MSQDTYRTFVCSSELFSEFKVSISLQEIETIDDIIQIMKQELIQVLQKNNFSRLIDKVNHSKFHIHSNTIEDILTSSINDIFYICDHC
jgi:hypothetical protein